MKISGIIWDYDGTLVDSRQKNLNVTKAVVSEIIGGTNMESSVLSSLENYERAIVKVANWKELYRIEFGLNEKQINYAGKLWTKYQLLDKTKVLPIDGISFVVPKLNKYPQGVVSQNSSDNIKKNLERYDLGKYFNLEEVGFTRQKPDPKGLLTCISEITNLNNNDSIVFIGDHVTDMQCAHYANKKIGRNAVISILLTYKNHNRIEDWEYKPDYIVLHPKDILGIIDEIKGV